MNKKFLSAILFGALMAASTGTFVSCKDYDDDIESLSDRISAVEALAKELQAQIQSGAVITNVAKNNNGVVVTLSNGNSFEVTNGADGKAGSVVSIGENGNWFIDGVDTGKPSQGAKGDKGDKGDQGEQGPAGEQGETGGIAPVYYYPGTAGAEDGYWVKVTTDANGNETKTVTDIKWAATVAGAEGVTALWSDDTLILKGVKGHNGDLVISLSGDLKAMVYEVDFVMDGQNAMEYVYVPYKAFTAGEGIKSTMKVHEIVSDSNSDAHETIETEEPYYVGLTDIEAEKWSFLNPVNVKHYHMDPATSVVPSWWTAKQLLDVVSKDADFLSTRALANDAAAKPSANFLSAAEGIMKVGFVMDGKEVMTQAEGDRYDLGIFWEDAESNDDKITDLAVQAPLDADKENVITSTYAAVYASQMAVEAIAYDVTPGSYANNFIFKTGDEDLYGCEALVGAAHDTPLADGCHLYDLSTDAAEQAPTVKLAYNSEVGINLHQLVTTHVGYNSALSWNKEATVAKSVEELKALGLEYKFEQVNFYVGGAGTEQSQNHSLLESRADGTYIVACGVKSLSDTDPTKVEADPAKKAKSYASIGRTPLIRVTLNDVINNKVVKVGYIKFKIVAPEEAIVSEMFDLGAFYYSCGEAKKFIAWHAIEDKLLDSARETSKATFDALYEIDLKKAEGDEDQTTEVKQYIRDGENFVEATQYVGVITEKADNGAETTDVFKWTVDRADFVNVYNANTKDYPEITITRYVKYNVKKNLGNSNFNKEPIYLPINITFRYPKGIMANKIAKYWYAENSMNEGNAVLSQEEMKFLHANVEVPAVKVEDWGEAEARFFIDLDSRFELFAIGHTDENQAGTTWCEAGEYPVENAPSIEVKKEAWGYDWNTEANFPDFVNENLRYYYFFNVKNNKNVVGVDGKTYTLTVGNSTANSPVMLYGESAEYLNTVLKANGDTIATINHTVVGGGTGTGGDHKAYIQLENNPTAKALLNVPAAWNKDVTAETLLKQTLDVEIEVAAFNACDEYLPLVNNTFGVEFLKPVYTYANGPIEFTDAHDNGMDMTKVNLADLVTFYDWRQWFFYTANDNANDDHLSYYNYYGVEAITVDTEDIMTNITGEWKSLKETSLDVEFHLYVDDAQVASPYTAGIPSATATWADIVKHFGELRYLNNTSTVVNFDIKVPVYIKHKWSEESLIVWVEGTVNRTEAN